MRSFLEWIKDKNNRRPLFVVIFLFLGVWIMIVIWRPPIQTVEGLAWCLRQKKAVMVEMKGICRECEDQKKDFREYIKYLTVLDCSVTALQCEKLGFSTFPIWRFVGKKPLVGRQTLKDLAVYAECPIARNFPVQ